MCCDKREGQWEIPFPAMGGLPPGGAGVQLFSSPFLIVDSVDGHFVDTSQAKHTAGPKVMAPLLQRNVVGRASLTHFRTERRHLTP